MKTLIAVIIALLPVSLFAQGNNFILEGKLGSLNTPAILYLQYNNEGKNVKDSGVLRNGYFKFSGKIKEPGQSLMILYHNGTNSNELNRDVSRIWLEPGHIKMISTDSLRKAVITGSKLNADQKALNVALKSNTDKTIQFYRENGYLSADKNQSAEFINEYHKKLDELRKEKKVIELKFIQSHPNSLISLVVLSTDYSVTNGHGNPDVSVVEPLFNSLTAHVKNSSMGSNYRDNIAKWKEVGVGSIAPDFMQYDTAGKPVKLSDYKGKYILVDFWASWCHPCREENPNLVKLYNQYAEKNFTILSVSLDDMKLPWLKAIKEDRLPWTQVSDLKKQNEAAKKYGVLPIPDNFLIAPDGKIIAKSIKGEDLSNKLKEILK